MVPTYLILFCFLVRFSKADFCENNFTLSELPSGLVLEAIDLLTRGVAVKNVGCPNVDIPINDVKLWLFNRNRKDIPIYLDQNDPKELDPNKKTIILVPGWLCNVTNDRIPELKDAYLIRYDANIIGIDWSVRSIDLYSNSFCSLPGIAKIVGRFLCNIDANKGIPVNSLHVVGHSMGAQLGGLVGQEVQLQCNKTLKRITGLDPSGILFQNIDKSRRLDKLDAEMVDVIHTDRFLGYVAKCGTVDFYPNCFNQPKCLFTLKEIQDGDALNAGVSFLACSHLRSADYMVASINTNKFISKSCETNPFKNMCKVDSVNPSIALMGEDCSPNTVHDKYYTNTDGNLPYAKV